nr:hypothetical protein [Tanacetum cinerariifolium]
MYKEYLDEFWYSAKTLETLRSLSLSPLMEDIIIKLNKRHREKVVPYTRFLSLLMMHKMMEGYEDASFIIHSESASGNDASAASIAKANLEKSAPSDFVPQQ